jgi:hypothetical protein
MVDEKILFLFCFIIFKKMNALETLRACGDLQRELFYTQFMSSGKAGEITCVNGVDNTDTVLFERFSEFIVVFRLLSEDSCDASDRHYKELPVEEFIKEKSHEQSEKYKHFLHQLVLEKRSLEDVKQEILAAGGDPASVDLIPFTRSHLEEMLQPGRKRINGDRNTRIQIMTRSSDIPNDLQRPAVIVHVLPMPAQVDHFYNSITTLEERSEWEDENLMPMMRDFEVGTSLPMYKHVINVLPTIYRFPEKEVDVERAMN